MMDPISRNKCKRCGEMSGEHTWFSHNGHVVLAYCPDGGISRWSIHSLQYMKEEK